jgi:hypothetical protein
LALSNSATAVDIPKLRNLIGQPVRALSAPLYTAPQIESALCWQWGCRQDQPRQSAAPLPATFDKVEGTPVIRVRSVFVLTPYDLPDKLKASDMPERCARRLQRTRPFPRALSGQRNTWFVADGVPGDRE